MLGYKKQKFIYFNVSITSPGLLNSTKFGELRLLLSECFLLLTGQKWLTTTSIFRSTGRRRKGSSLYVLVDRKYPHAPFKWDYWLSRNLNKTANIQGFSKKTRMDVLAINICFRSHVSFICEYLILTHENRGTIFQEFSIHYSYLRDN